MFYVNMSTLSSHVPIYEIIEFRNLMRQWLNDNVGEHTKTSSGYRVNEGLGWQIVCNADQSPVIWYAMFENENDALMFKLRFS